MSNVVPCVVCDGHGYTDDRYMVTDAWGEAREEDVRVQCAACEGTGHTTPRPFVNWLQIVTDLLTHAAQTDGAHHKQHDICAALKVLLSAEDYAALGIVDEGVPS